MTFCQIWLDIEACFVENTHEPLTLHRALSPAKETWMRDRPIGYERHVIGHDMGVFGMLDWPSPIAT